MVLPLMEDKVEGNKMGFSLEYIEFGRCLRNASGGGRCPGGSVGCASDF